MRQLRYIYWSGDFQDYSKLVFVAIPNNVKCIVSETFSGSDALETIVICVKSIFSLSFANFKKLIEMTRV